MAALSKRFPLFIITLFITITFSEGSRNHSESQYGDQSYIRINCGGPWLNDSYGHVWQADDQSNANSYSQGGYAVNVSTGYGGTIYNSARIFEEKETLNSGNRYNFTVSKSKHYVLRLHFSPPTAQNSSMSLETETFSVVLNGETLISSYNFEKSQSRENFTDMLEVYLPCFSSRFLNLTFLPKAVTEILTENGTYPSKDPHAFSSKTPNPRSPRDGSMHSFVNGIELIHTRNDVYLIRLHFADISKACDVVIDQSGLIDVVVNGIPVAMGYNITYYAGNQFVADIRDFFISPLFENSLSITLFPSSLYSGTNPPTLAAIEVYQVYRGFLSVSSYNNRSNKGGNSSTSGDSTAGFWNFSKDNLTISGEMAGQILMDLKESLGNPQELSTWGLNFGQPCLTSWVWTGVGCKAGEVVSIILPHMGLNGTLNASIGSLVTLETFWVFGNHISGRLPAEIGNLSRLNSLLLHNNSFSGRIPVNFGNLKKLFEFTVDYNELTGAVPYALLNLPTLYPLLNFPSYVRYTPGNPSLCAPLNSSIRADLPLCTTDGTEQRWLLIASVTGAVGALAVLITAVLGGYYLGARRDGSGGKEKEGQVPKQSFFQKRGLGYFRLSFRQSQKLQNALSVGKVLSAGKIFTFRELQKATQKFSEQNLLGSGGFGKVYRGILPDGRYVAIKRHVAGSGQGFNQFYMELETLSKVRHRHLVSLIGYCQEAHEMILVYEYMPRGTLRDHLPPNKGHSIKLSWERRLEIAIGAAKGLDYLHHGLNPPLIHRDVKSTNILLDADLSAKVGDFGLTRIGPTAGETHVSTAVRGSFGYLDPEYYKWLQLTEKSDVYSLGVVLLELVAGRKVIDLSRSVENSHVTEVNLVEWSRPFLLKEMVDEVVDSALNGKFQEASMKLVGRLVLRCLQESGSVRPAMDEVVRELELALRIETKRETIAKQTSDACEALMLIESKASSHPSSSSLDSDAEFHNLKNFETSPRFKILSSR